MLKFKDDFYLLKFSVAAVLKGHAGPVTSVDALTLPAQSRTIIITTSTDSSVKIWEKRENKGEFCNNIYYYMYIVNLIFSSKNICDVVSI